MSEDRVGTLLEFTNRNLWYLYVESHMDEALEEHDFKSVRIMNGIGQPIAVWLESGYGFIHESRLSARLFNGKTAKNRDKS